MPGDLISGARVIGFCSVAGEGDYVLLAGQERLPEPPALRLPVAGDPAELERAGGQA
jgi:hypothetical protein